MYIQIQQNNTKIIILYIIFLSNFRTEWTKLCSMFQKVLFFADLRQCKSCSRQIMAVTSGDQLPDDRSSVAVQPIKNEPKKIVSPKPFFATFKKQNNIFFPTLVYLHIVAIQTAVYIANITTVIFIEGVACFIITGRNCEQFATKCPVSICPMFRGHRT